MHVGFTGTQRGMTRRQQRALREVLAGLRGVSALHHGDCVGADAQAHDIARLHFIPVHLHPPDDDAKRARCGGAALEHPPRPYLERNGDIAAACGVLIAAPRQSSEILRSGTWATVRAARRLGRQIIIIGPDGAVRRDEPARADLLEEAV